MHTNNGVSWRALSCAARVASIWALLMSLACGDSGSQGLSGEQPGAANVSEQGLLQTDLTVTEAVNGSTHSYIATLPPAAVVGTIEQTLSQTLEASWNASLQSISQAPSYPEGWSIDYYAGDTRLASEPVTTSEWAQVSRVTTTGSFQVEALDGERLPLSSTVSGTTLAVADSFSGGSVGDGWDVFFDPAYTRVFNIHHHNNPATVMCRNLKDASTCPGFPIHLTQTSMFSTGHIDAASNKLWQPTVTTNAKLAWDCVDLTTAARCATPVVFSKYTAPTFDYNSHMYPVVISRRMYALGITNGGATRITCLDMATRAECPGVALKESGVILSAGLAAVGNKLYVLPGLNQHLDCYDSTTWQRCAGAWPQAVTRGPVWAVHGADGLVSSICASSRCFGLDGSAHTLPPRFTVALAAAPPDSSATNLGTRAAWRLGFAAYCWDLTTDAKCADRFPIGVASLYTTTLDPKQPDCLWTNGDDGVIRNWNIRTGDQGCSHGVSHIIFEASVSVPRVSCAPASSVYQYKSFKLTSPESLQYTSARLTVRDSRGVTIPGWANVPLSSTDGTADLSSLSPAATGSTPTFDVAIESLTDTGIEPIGEFRVTTGYPQLCWDLSTPPPICPTLPGQAGHDTANSLSTIVTAKGLFTISTDKEEPQTVPFADQVLSTTVDTNPPNVDNCGTRLRATVVSLENDSPIAGVKVFLLDSNGNPIRDSNDQQIFAISEADGTVEFPVWAAGYMLKISRNAHYTPITATVDVGGSGVTVVSAGTLISNTVTTTVNQTSHVIITVSADQQPPGAPAVTAPEAAVNTQTPVIGGTAEPKSTVEVWLDGKVAGTVAVDSVGAWSFTVLTALSEEQHRASAIATDQAGNVGPSSEDRNFTIDATPPDAPVVTTPGAVINTRTPIVRGTAEPNSKVKVWLDDDETTAKTVEVDATGAWSFIASTALEFGAHSISAIATDAAGNTSDQTNHSFLFQRSHYGWGCTTAPALPPIWALLALALSLGRRYRRTEKGRLHHRMDSKLAAADPTTRTTTTAPAPSRSQPANPGAAGAFVSCHQDPPGPGRLEAQGNETAEEP